MATWPPTLNACFSLDAFSQSGPLDNVRETQMDAGISKRRRRFSGALRRVSLRIPKATKADVDVFETFYEQALGGGVIVFDMKHPVTGIIRDWRFADIQNPYTLSLINNEIQSIDFSLELLP